MSKAASGNKPGSKRPGKAGKVSSPLAQNEGLLSIGECVNQPLEEEDEVLTMLTNLAENLGRQQSGSTSDGAAATAVSGSSLPVANDQDLLKRGCRKHFTDSTDLERICLEAELESEKRENKRIRAENKSLQARFNAMQSLNFGLQGQLAESERKVQKMTKLLERANASNGREDASPRFGLVRPAGMQALFGSSGSGGHDTVPVEDD